MTRPRGPARQALRQAVDEWGQPLTWRDMARFAQVGFAVAKATTKNMARAGELQVVGTVREPGTCRPMRLYAPGAPAPQAQPSAAGTGADLVRCWMSPSARG